jgi:hypothetical protein
MSIVCVRRHRDAYRSFVCFAFHTHCFKSELFYVLTIANAACKHLHCMSCDLRNDFNVAHASMTSEWESLATCAPSGCCIPCCPLAMHATVPLGLMLASKSSKSSQSLATSSVIKVVCTLVPDAGSLASTSKAVAFLNQAQPGEFSIAVALENKASLSVLCTSSLTHCN